MPIYSGRNNGVIIASEQIQWPSDSRKQSLCKSVLLMKKFQTIWLPIISFRVKRRKKCCRHSNATPMKYNEDMCKQIWMKMNIKEGSHKKFLHLFVISKYFLVPNDIPTVVFKLLESRPPITFFSFSNMFK